MDELWIIQGKEAHPKTRDAFKLIKIKLEELYKFEIITFYDKEKFYNNLCSCNFPIMMLFHLCECYTFCSDLSNQATAQIYFGVKGRDKFLEELKKIPKFSFSFDKKYYEGSLSHKIHLDLLNEASKQNMHNANELRSVISNKIAMDRFKKDGVSDLDVIATIIGMTNIKGYEGNSNGSVIDISFKPENDVKKIIPFLEEYMPSNVRK